MAYVTSTMKKMIENPSRIVFLTFICLLLIGCGLDIAPEPTAVPTPVIDEVENPVPVAAEPTISPTATSDEPPSCASEARFCVGLVTDVGLINDKSFNQSAWEGVLRAEDDLLADVDFIQTRTQADYEKNILFFAEQDYDVIVTVGFGLAEATTSAAAKYPNIDFIGVEQFQATEYDNIAGLIFPSDKAGFLAGALAAMISQNGRVGAVLATAEVPPVVEFREGYEAGAYAVNPDITIVSIHHPGGADVAFTDSVWGASTAQLIIEEENLDVVFGAGGTTGNAALVAIAENSNAFCIGVDTDQWQTVPDAHPCLITSAVKEIGDGVFELVAWSLLDQFPRGNYAGGVALAPFHDFSESIPADAQAFLIDLKADLLNDVVPTDGSYVFPSAPSVTIQR